MCSQIRFQGTGVSIYAYSSIHHFLKDLNFVAVVVVPKSCFESALGRIKQDLQIYSFYISSFEVAEAGEMGEWGKQEDNRPLEAFH